MTIRIYNTLSRKKEEFVPIKTGKVAMYVCGPTVYDSCHIGHARSVIVFDLIARYFKATGYELTYVRNFTDVDDKIINRANELGVSSKDLAEKYILEFYRDMDALHVQRATFEPRATEHIDQIIQFIETLISKKFAYTIDGDVYFSVEAFKDYGKLSGRKLEDMEAGARVNIDERKHNPFDFALWKSAKPGEPSWESPWGKGRPGWHIECSAMSTQYLGQTFDIHGGGKDLIFPHHENEIAQSEAASGLTFARYWVHNGFININHEKMSKSLGNFLLIKDILTQYHPESVRLFILSSHYRSPIDFTDNAMVEAVSNLDKLYGLLERIEKALGPLSEIDVTKQISGEYWQRFCEAMDDDFNSARGIGILFDSVRAINRLLDDYPDGLPSDALDTLRRDYADIMNIGSILGILFDSPEDYFDQKKSQGLARTSIDPAAIDQLIQDRADARKAKDWARADQIKKQLSDMNIILEDRPEGTTWKIQG
ncbi:MAG: cysteine--tRNA ligase [Desulfobacterales bacterium]|nr:cysteine--tRNA ligase [Desulfobacterales bacterium]MDD4072371.1 cysteine--tRNA ligase [Desulfobacterales bacterium]MDD4393043.1 cysteine--tRNA ligase [Desulfobacterales bacterium]